MEPPAEVVNWMFGVGFVFLGLCLLAEAIVGPDVWRHRRWREGGKDCRGHRRGL